VRARGLGRRVGGAPLALIPADASPQEAAAIVAAIEQFVRDSAAPAPAPSRAHEQWTQAALLEAVEHEPGKLLSDPWINT
jgi:hypothetical protein